MFVCCECCVLSGRVLCDELITRPENSYRLCCVVVCDLEPSWMRRPWTALGHNTKREKKSYVDCLLAVLILLMMDSKSVRNMWSYLRKIKLKNSASCWLLL
jgi:hypothetical protein